MLTLRALGTRGRGLVVGSEPYRYEVIGLPTGSGAIVARLSGVWKILRIQRGRQWTGSFVSAEDALASIDGEVPLFKPKHHPTVRKPTICARVTSSQLSPESLPAVGGFDEQRLR
jgi:hypothetical protein